MPSSGEVLEHPVTREKIVFRRTARDTGGEMLQMDVYIQPGGFVAAEHIHPLQEERFEVITGVLAGRTAGKSVTASAGDHRVVPAGTPHAWWNPGDEEWHVLVEQQTALNTESFFATFFGLAQDGKVNPKTGLPNLLQMAVLMRARRAEIVLARPPRPVQTLLFGTLAVIGRMLGYKGKYPYPAPRSTQAEPSPSV